MTRTVRNFGLIYLVAWAGYAIYSYSQVDPNLVLSSQPLLWSIQNWLWTLGYHERSWSSLIYLVIISVLFFSYFNLIRHFKAPPNKEANQFRKILVAAVIILFGTYPALTHDIYNYVFNAKMVLQYHENPHIKTALEFPQDPWLKYMNNVHTPAPYAYGFTLMSLVPYALGLGNLKLTVIMFRLVMLFFWIVLLIGQKKLIDQTQLKWWWAFALNPLVLLETIGNIHNDVIMMALAVFSVICFKRMSQNKWWLLPAAALLLLSISVKYASVMLILGTGIWWLLKQFKRNWSFGGVQAATHFLPLLTSRSQRFLPWYLIWPLTFLPITKEKLERETLLLFSFSALLSYMPYLYTGGYSPTSQVLRQIIIFVPPLSYALSFWLLDRKHKKTNL